MQILKIIDNKGLLSVKTEKRKCLPKLIKFLRTKVVGSYYSSNV